MFNFEDKTLTININSEEKESVILNHVEYKNETYLIMIKKEEIENFVDGDKFHMDFDVILLKEVDESPDGSPLVRLKAMDSFKDNKLSNLIISAKRHAEEVLRTYMKNMICA